MSIRQTTGLRLSATLAVIMLCAGCVTKMSQVVTHVGTQGRPVTVKVSGAGFLHLSAPKLEAKAVDRLREECPGGEITDISSELRARDFVGLVQKYTLRVSGMCL